MGLRAARRKRFTALIFEWGEEAKVFFSIKRTKPLIYIFNRLYCHATKIILCVCITRHQWIPYETIFLKNILDLNKKKL